MKKKDFSEVLEKGAQVDDIFKDARMPLGSNPFGNVEAGTSLAPINENLPATDNLVFEDDSQLVINRKFAALESLFRLVTKECSFGEMASEILRTAMEQIKSEAGSFFEIDYQNQCMFFRAVTGRSSESLLSVTVPMGSGVVGFVCQNQQPMALSSVDDNTMYLRAISDSVGFETKNIIAYPVVIRGATFGCIELLNRLGEPRYTDADKEVLSAICECAARIIENRLVSAALSRELRALKRDKGEQAA